MEQPPARLWSLKLVSRVLSVLPIVIFAALSLPWLFVLVARKPSEESFWFLFLFAAVFSLVPIAICYKLVKHTWLSPSIGGLRLSVGLSLFLLTIVVVGLFHPPESYDDSLKLLGYLIMTLAYTVLMPWLARKFDLSNDDRERLLKPPSIFVFILLLLHGAHVYSEEIGNGSFSSTTRSLMVFTAVFAAIAFYWSVKALGAVARRQWLPTAPIDETKENIDGV